MNFWNNLFNKGPVVGLSPMDGVTDAPMRYMVAKYGRPSPKATERFGGVDVVFTEFVSVDALKHAKNPEAVERLMTAFVRAQDVGPLEQKPYEVAQVFGHDPELFYQAAVIVATLGYDGMDINMGCPAHKVEEHGSGAGLIRTPVLAQAIVRHAKQGIADWASGKVTVSDLEISEAVKSWVSQHVAFRPFPERAIPVSVKTRIGVDSVVVEEWMATLMEVKPAVITLHGRTLKQLYQGQADWDVIGRAAAVVHSLGGHILGNGDIQSLADLQEKVRHYGVDGGLIGRASEGNPGIFAGFDNPTWEQRKAWMIEHAKVYEQVFDIDHFVPMRKHLVWYCKGFPGASLLREKLVRVSSQTEVCEVLHMVDAIALPSR